MEVRFRPVLTPFGCAVVIVAFVLLIRSLLSRNSYEIIISVSALFLLLVLFVIGLWKSKKLKTMEPGWKPPFPMTAAAVEETFISGLDTSIPLFFRLHFFIKGRFFPCGNDFSADNNNGCPLLLETSVPRNESASGLPLDFPVSGIFHGEGFCRLCDIFGFFSFSCGQSQQKTANIRSAPCFGQKTLINPQTGAEDKRNKPASDIERYHMREYTPGDRFRDINWKSSDKIDTLITRISTDNQEKISRIEIFLRNFAIKRKHGFSLNELWLLDRCKAQLMYFIRSLMEQSSSFIFNVRAAERNWEIENQNDLDAFFEELSGLSFFSLQNETEVPQGSGDIYVFSTACDFGLSAFLLSCNPRPVTLFLAQPGDKKANGRFAPSIQLKVENENMKVKIEEQKTGNEAEKLFFSDFFSNGFTVPPDLLCRSKVKSLNVRAGKTEMFYAEVNL
ncbi:MAG: DUF58 domain-containing protein [Treponema sp.]|nr:DUF58 domain-containing protein [Treponema sp.]